MHGRWRERYGSYLSIIIILSSWPWGLGRILEHSQPGKTRAGCSGASKKAMSIATVACTDRPCAVSRVDVGIMRQFLLWNRLVTNNWFHIQSGPGIESQAVSWMRLEVAI